MPVPKKKPITSKSEPSMLEPSSLVLPVQQAFHRYLHTLAQSAIRTVIEPVMREEGDAFIVVALTCAEKRSRVTK